MQVAATIIALAALWLSTWAVLTTRLTARMSALPLLHPFQESHAEQVTPLRGAPFVSAQLLARLVNGGLGPAIVTKYELFADGVLIDLPNKKQTQTLLTTLFRVKPETTDAEYFSLEGGAIAVPKDDFIKCLLLKFSVPTYDDLEPVLAGLQRLRIRVEYQSMYGDELLYEGETAPIPPRLSLFRKHKRVRAAMLATKRRRFWIVVSAVWIAFWMFALFYAWVVGSGLNLQGWYGYVVLLVLFGLVPVAIGWGLLVGVPATLRWIKAGKQ